MSKPNPNSLQTYPKKPKQQPGWMFDIPATANQHHRYYTFEPVLDYIKAKIWYGSQQMTKNDKMGRKMLKRMVQL